MSQHHPSLYHIMATGNIVITTLMRFPPTDCCNTKHQSQDRLIWYHTWLVHLVWLLEQKAAMANRVKDNSFFFFFHSAFSQPERWSEYLNPFGPGQAIHIKRNLSLKMYWWQEGSRGIYYFIALVVCPKISYHQKVQHRFQKTNYLSTFQAPFVLLHKTNLHKFVKTQTIYIRHHE